MSDEAPYVIQQNAELTCVFCGRAATGPRQLLSLRIISTGEDNPNVFVHVDCFRSALHPSLVAAIELKRAILNPAQ